MQETAEQINLAAEGLRLSIPIPGFHFPGIVGPFNYFDARANLSESFSLTSLRNADASRQNARSARSSAKDSRDLVALAVAGMYLQLIASSARIDTTKTQIDAARAVYQQAADRNRNGLNAHIDVSRSRVELQTQQERLISLTNDFEKQKITLARLIGLPLGQTFTLTNNIPRTEPAALQLDDLLRQAFTSRADVKAAEAQVKAAELTRAAAVAEHYPSIDLHADYGDIGVNPAQSHGTFTVTGGVSFPLWTSGRVQADIEQADAALAQRKAELEDSKGRAEQDVRDAVLDVQAATEQVHVAESNRALASDTLQQADDRFRSGVADTIEVVQAQESVATAQQDFTSALFALNLAEVSLARSIGQTEQGVLNLMQGAGK